MIDERYAHHMVNDHYAFGKTYEELFGEELAKQRKRYLIDINTGENNPRYGKSPSPETKQKMRNALTGENNPNFGKTYEEMHGQEKALKLKKQLSLALRGENNPLFGKTLEEIHDEETAQQIKKQISNSQKGEKNHNFGKPMPDEAKRKISGENHYNFQGWYITPLGKFASANEFRNACPNIIGINLKIWCKNNKKIITKGAIAKSPYLTEDTLGKTFEEIGFNFEPK